MQSTVCLHDMWHYVDHNKWTYKSNLKIMNYIKDQRNNIEITSITYYYSYSINGGII